MKNEGKITEMTASWFQINRNKNQIELIKINGIEQLRYISNIYMYNVYIYILYYLFCLLIQLTWLYWYSSSFFSFLIISQLAICLIVCNWLWRSKWKFLCQNTEAANSEPSIWIMSNAQENCMMIIKIEMISSLSSASCFFWINSIKSLLSMLFTHLSFWLKTFRIFIHFCSFAFLFVCIICWLLLLFFHLIFEIVLEFRMKLSKSKRFI